MNRRPIDFDRLGDLLEDACGPLRTGGVDGHVGRPETSVDSRPRTVGGLSVARLLASAWAEAVGQEVATNTRPLQLREGRLTVSASSPAWAQTLQLMAETIRDRLNERLGAETVTEVVFRHAGWEENRHRSPPPRGRPEKTAGPGYRDAGRLIAPTPEEEAAIAKVKDLGLEPDLEESILRAMRASFGRI